METITLVRSNAQISNLNVQGQIADVMWRWETTRTDFGTAQLRFHFTDEEVGGPGATVLLHVAPTPAGPWTPRIAFQSRRRNEISAASGIPRYFALESRPMPNILRLQ